ncbi:ABC1 family protein [Cardiosporidium cionae]|uniref:ABC1 family protein n=1 Tax=Cardiosporidium cionae TaxID=476202 RepID=A0ABQ7J5L2_9APIC|nr:ABC1 family protein [Cardiosporidium cionae]|eukprot:KAF8819296.1 ABC1 family protein [Cardiosporidium cionae]
MIPARIIYRGRRPRWRWLAGIAGLVLIGSHSFNTYEKCKLDLNNADWDRLSFPIAAVVRCYRVVACASASYLDYWINDGSSNAAAHQRAANRFLELARRNKGVYIKIAQHASSLVHLLPREYVDTLKILQTEAPKSPFSDVKAIVEKELGISDLSEIFSDFDEQPVGSASLAQVHFATLRLNGEKVAVKVQHKEIRQLAKLDIRIVTLFIRCTSLLFPTIRLDWLKDLIEENLPNETDFLKEAQNADHARKIIENFHIGSISITDPTSVEIRLWNSFISAMTYLFPHLSFLFPRRKLHNDESASEYADISRRQEEPDLFGSSIEGQVPQSHRACIASTNEDNRLKNWHTSAVEHEMPLACKDSTPCALSTPQKHVKERHNIIFRVPRIHWDLSTSRILVMEKCDGVNITDIGKLEKKGISKLAIAQAFCSLYCHLIFEEEFLHSDPHPGNLLVDADILPSSMNTPITSTARSLICSSLGNCSRINVEKNLRITLLDHGIYCTTSKETRWHYANLWSSIIEGNFEGMQRSAEFFGIPEHAELLACILSGRSSESVREGIKNSRSTASEESLYRSRAARLALQVNSLLGKMPHELIMILKSNDLVRYVLRSLEMDETLALLLMQKSVTRALCSKELTFGSLSSLQNSITYCWKSAQLAVLNWLIVKGIQVKARQKYEDTTLPKQSPLGS